MSQQSYLFELVNKFSLLRRGTRISSLQADLYYTLLAECNQRFWPTSFQWSNRMICGFMGITEKSLIEARKRLKDYGLIDYDSGITKQKAPTYYLLQSCNEYSNNGGNNGGNEEVKTGVLNGTFLKTRQRKRKEESSTAVAVEAEDVIEVDKVDKVEYETYSKLLQWIEKNASNVGKMKEPLTYDEFMKLKKTVDKEQLKTLLQSMHNWQPLLKKNNSAYLTIVTWSKRPHNQATKKSTGRGAQGFNGALADLENDLIARKHKLDWATSEIRRKEIMAED